MRIAIASSGLAHVTRGIESWALDTGRALQATGADVTLFSSTHPTDAPTGCIALGTAKRTGKLARLLARATPRPLWRRGFTSSYGWEQALFWRALGPRLRDGGFDLLHVQDPMVAWWCRRARARGTITTREILAHGTEEPASFLAPFEYVQHLAPWHQEQVEGALGRHPAGWCMLPNFVDTESFRPDPAAYQRVRDELDIPADALVVGSAAAIKRDHKRIDYLISELAACAPTLMGRPLFLLLCGASQPDTEMLKQQANLALGSRVRILTDCPRQRMPELLAAMDLFVLPSLFEMMPIAVLEALACGLPLLLNDHPVLRWMGGADSDERTRGADCIDMGSKGALHHALTTRTTQQLATRAAGARQRATSMFGKHAVIGQYCAYYRRILETQCEGTEE